MLRSSLYVLLVLLTCAILIARRIKAMRRAQSELQRRREIAIAAHHEQLVVSLIDVRITCDAAPAIEGIAKAADALRNAFAGFNGEAERLAYRFAKAFGGDVDGAIERAIRNAPSDE